jgi:hypothetical protein
MNHHNTSTERRRHPRIIERVPFKLRAEDFDVLTETINVSCIGAYCQLDKYIPFMTGLKISLALPRGDQKKKFEYAECNGVVVRVEEVESHDHTGSVYNTAIYFNEIEESEKEKIASFFKDTSGKKKEIGDVSK